MVRRILWSLSPAELRQWFDASAEEGLRLTTLSSFGPPSTPRYCAVWTDTPGPRQSLRLGLSGIDLIHLASDLGDGPYPSLVAGTGPVGSASYAVVLDHWKRLAVIGKPAPARPKLVGPMMWTPFKALCDDGDGFDRLRYYLRSVCVVGVNNDESTNLGLLSCSAILWPRLPGMTQTSTSVSALSDKVRQDGQITVRTHWGMREETVVLGSQASPIVLRTVPGDNGYKDVNVVLWRDEQLQPWPFPHPFDREERRFLVTEETAVMVDARYYERLAEGWQPQCISASGLTAEEARWQIIWTRATPDRFLPRKFVRNGPGDGATAIFLTGPVRSSAAVAQSVGTADRIGVAGPSLSPGDPPQATPLTRDQSAMLGAPAGGVHRNVLGAASALPSPQTAPPEAVDLRPHLAAMPLLDRTVYQYMRERGPRAAQLAVLRRGRLVFLRAYTYAEEGYPITRISHRIRIGSCAKSMTACFLAPVIRAQPGGLNRTLVDELGVGTPVLQPLRSATILDALRHETGLDTTSGDNPALTPAIAFAYANGRTNVPFDDGDGDANRTVERKLELLGTDVRLGVQGGGTEVECRAGHEVTYHTTPLAYSGDYVPGSPAIAPYPYAMPMYALSSAGGWSLSPLAMARFLAGLTPRAGFPSTLDFASLDELAVHQAGWSVAEPVVFSVNRYVQTRRAYHNGAIAGARAWLGHQYSRLDPGDTWSIFFAVNKDDGLEDYPCMAQLWDAVAQIEFDGGWLDGDLLAL